MTNEEAKKMLEAKLKCLIAETSGTNHDCNMRLCDGCALNYEQGNMGEQKQALDMAIKALEQTRWIPVSERLPEEGQSILFSTKTDEVFEGTYFNVGEGNRNWYAYRDENYAWNNVVIAWMPLPQPYKAESENKG